MANNITCTCGHSWNKSSSSKKDMNVCHICGKDNTMKNGGWLDSYDNVPEAQNGIEGTMGGLTDQGFNYNGAWGGPSMQMGGSMPGAVGFTYARTAGAAPSNGPYAKKTMASAQDGTYVKKPRTDILTMDEYSLKKALANQPVIQSPKGKQLTKEQIFAKNKQTAEAQGKRFNPNTGAVTPFLSSSTAKTFERASENIVEPMIELEMAMSAAPFVGKGLKAATKASKVVNNAVKTAKPTSIGSVAENAVQSIQQSTQQPWSVQDLPGLHLKSTMSDGTISKIVEPKTGLINVDQALAIIGKESGGADKLTLIKQGLGENVPKKMDFNDFRKVVQDQLIPLERKFVTKRSDYGIENLGYTPLRQGTTLTERFQDFMNTPVSKLFKKPELLENQTLILGNKSKFGRGSDAHGNPKETLGHAHFLRDGQTPDVLTVTQIQSDAFQGTYRGMAKNIDDATTKLKKLQEDIDADLYLFKGEEEKFKSVFENSQKSLDLEKASVENFSQKSLLDKNHQERYLQELVDYVGKRGDINKMRVPTSETAAKVQNYRETSLTGDNAPGFGKIQEEISVAVRQGDQQKVNDLMKVHDEMLKTPYKTYGSDEQTILKKYSEQPKTIKKLFGVEPKTVTDAKGNSWYEFNIPKKFKEGKGEIKAFKQGGNVKKDEGWLSKYEEGGVIEDDRGQWEHPGEITKINSNQITMQGVPYNVLGISDTGDTQMMYPGEDYKFKGNKVTEYPIKKNGGWLEKYN